MPVVTVTLLPGYGSDTESRLVQRLALATRSVINAPAAGTTVFVQHANTYSREGRVFSGGGAALADAAAVVRSFLDHMQVRDLAAAGALLAPGFTMAFPDSAPMTRLEELVAWARMRYRHIAKDYERIEQCWGDGHTVVYCSGTLRGAWPDGSAFEGVRFIDRFELADGLIRRQDVWNDLADARSRRASSA